MTLITLAIQHAHTYHQAGMHAHQVSATTDATDKDIQ